MNWMYWFAYHMCGGEFAHHYQVLNVNIAGKMIITSGFLCDVCEFPAHVKTDVRSCANIPAHQLESRTSTKDCNLFYKKISQSNYFKIIFNVTVYPPITEEKSPEWIHQWSCLFD